MGDPPIDLSTGFTIAGLGFRRDGLVARPYAESRDENSRRRAELDAPSVKMWKQEGPVCQHGTGKRFQGFSPFRFQLCLEGTAESWKASLASKSPPEI